MRPGLLHPQDDVALDASPPLEGRALEADLALATIVGAMAQGNHAITVAANRLLLDPLTDVATIAYRQAVLRDCLAHPDVPRALFALASATLERRSKVYWGLVRRPDAMVHHGIELLHLYGRAFRDLRRVADTHHGRFEGDGPRAPGFGAFLARLRRDLDDAFLAEIDAHVRALRFRAGVRVSARLGTGNAGTGYVLEPPEDRAASLAVTFARWWRRLRRAGAPTLTYRLPSHDDGGLRALADLQARGLQRTANALAGAADGILGFFRQLQGELAFYVGALNLVDTLTAFGAPTCTPQPLPLPGLDDTAAPRAGAFRAAATDLYDAGLALTLGHPVVGNDLDTDGTDLVVVTGANGGGKTTFLRSVGVAQLLMQAGLMVPATSYRWSVTPRVFTHFTRREDAAMRSGKLDEELARLSAIVTESTPGATLLLNESFASTNEREGSELARQVVSALTEAGVRIVFVTHLSQFARGLHASGRPGTLFLRAERRPDGTRTFRMVEGPPTRTSHGADLYRKVVDGVEGGRSLP
jgi:hypothetical protein